MAELVMNGVAESAGCAFKNSKSRDLSTYTVCSHVPLACTNKQPQSTDTTHTNIIAVATNATTSLCITSTTITNMNYVLRYKP